jgi:hypothetical protein
MSLPYYSEDGAAFCEHCAPDDAQPGYFAETDTPEHCETCEALLETNLTEDGRAYVKNAIESYLKRGDGRGDILLEWAQKWFPDYTEKVSNEMDTRRIGDVMAADVGGVNTHLWNALSAAVDALKADMQHLPEDLAKQRQAVLADMESALEQGKGSMFTGYKSASKEDR